MIITAHRLLMYIFIERSFIYRHNATAGETTNNKNTQIDLEE